MGLALGFLVGVKLTPVVLSVLDENTMWATAVRTRLRPRLAQAIPGRDAPESVPRLRPPDRAGLPSLQRTASTGSNLRHQRHPLLRPPEDHRHHRAADQAHHPPAGPDSEPDRHPHGAGAGLSRGRVKVRVTAWRWAVFMSISKVTVNSAPISGSTPSRAKTRVSVVSNGSCIRRLGLRSMGAARTRNIVAVLAIALTTVLFTSLFSIAASLNASFQQQNFRQAGGDCHGTFKDLSYDQVEELRGDPLIREGLPPWTAGPAAGCRNRWRHSACQPLLSAIRPSSMRTIRSAIWAISSLWVIMTMVWAKRTPVTFSRLITS